MMFVRTQEKPFRITIIIGWMDDLLCLGDRGFINETISRIKLHNFDVTINENARAYAGIQFERIRNRRYMKMHQSEYAKQIIYENNMTDCRHTRSPMVKISTEQSIQGILDRKIFCSK